MQICHHLASTSVRCVSLNQKRTWRSLSTIFFSQEKQVNIFFCEVNAAHSQVCYPYSFMRPIIAVCNLSYFSPHNQPNGLVNKSCPDFTSQHDYNNWNEYVEMTNHAIGVDKLLSSVMQRKKPSATRRLLLIGRSNYMQLTEACHFLTSIHSTFVVVWLCWRPRRFVCQCVHVLSTAHLYQQAYYNAFVCCFFDGAHAVRLMLQSVHSLDFI